MDQALLVGINKYPGAPLQGCINDVTDMAAFLVTKCGYKKANVRLLTDERATKTAIIERLGWLLIGIRQGDRVLFHYSGHGAQMPTRNPQGEVDNLDEVICPVDFDWSDEHAIRDKEFNKIFSTVPDGVEFIWISDSCHSGDLTREFPNNPQNRIKTMLPPADMDWRIQTAKEASIKAMTIVKSTANLNVALIAGCRSDQTSADAHFQGRPNGALTYFLLQELRTKNGLKEPLTTLVDNVRNSLKVEFKQVPQLEGSAIIGKKAFLTV